MPARASRQRRVVQIGVAGQAGFQGRIHPRGLVGRQSRRRDLGLVGGSQVRQLVADVVEHDIGGVAATLLGQLVALRGSVDANFYRVGVAEQVVDVAEDLLVG